MKNKEAKKIKKTSQYKIFNKNCIKIKFHLENMSKKINQYKFHKKMVNIFTGKHEDGNEIS